jgi:two-component system sensor histidine kinase PilS (NtrC family)
MRIVVKEADRLSGLLTNFLIYARPKTPELQAVNVSRVLDEVIEVSRQDRRFGQIGIACHYPSDMVRNVDRDQIRQALWSLLINAAEAAGPNGSIRVALNPGDGSLSIEDDGPGIPEEIQERVFEPFFTTKIAGTGMGLATVFSIIEAHNGTLEILSGSSGGARFRILLPDALPMT